MNPFSNASVFSWLIRYWRLHVFTMFAVIAALNDAVFAHLGSLIYVPAIGSMLLDSTLLLRHLFYQQTLDLDAADGTFAREWRELDPRTRQILTAVYFAALFLGLALVAASVGK